MQQRVNIPDTKQEVSKFQFTLENFESLKASVKSLSQQIFNLDQKYKQQITINQDLQKTFQQQQEIDSLNERNNQTQLQISDLSQEQAQMNENLNQQKIVIQYLTQQRERFENQYKSLVKELQYLRDNCQKETETLEKNKVKLQMDIEEKSKDIEILKKEIKQYTFDIANNKQIQKQYEKDFSQEEQINEKLKSEVCNSSNTQKGLEEQTDKLKFQHQNLKEKNKELTKQRQDQQAIINNLVISIKTRNEEIANYEKETLRIQNDLGNQTIEIKEQQQILNKQKQEKQQLVIKHQILMINPQAYQDSPVDQQAGIDVTNNNKKQIQQLEDNHPQQPQVQQQELLQKEQQIAQLKQDEQVLIENRIKLMQKNVSLENQLNAFQKKIDVFGEENLDWLFKSLFSIVTEFQDIFNQLTEEQRHLFKCGGVTFSWICGLLASYSIDYMLEQKKFIIGYIIHKINLTIKLDQESIQKTTQLKKLALQIYTPEKLYNFFDVNVLDFQREIEDWNKLLVYLQNINQIQK